MKVSKPAAAVNWSPAAAVGITLLAFLLPQVVLVIVLLAGGQEPEVLFDLDPWPLVAVESALAVMSFGILFTYLQRKKSGLRELGLVRIKDYKQTAIDIAKAAGIYLLATTAVFAVLSGVLSEEVLNQSQDTGFENINRTFNGLLPVAISLILIAPIVEEVIFRGFLFRGLRSKLGFWVSAVISGGLFALAHGQLNVGIDVFILAVAAAWLVEQTGSTLAAIALHGLKNTVAFALVFVFV